MNRIEIERNYWDTSAFCADDIDRVVCDQGLEDVCIEAVEPQLSLCSKTLEIGCGVGRVATRIKTGGKVYGIDISREMILEAERRFNSPSYDNGEVVEYKLCDGRNIPYPNDFFQNVYSVAVFQHVERDGVINYINEAYRVLSQDGVFRFQFIQGDEDESFSKHYDLLDIFDWVQTAGFSITCSEKGLVHHQWSWITAIKGAQ